MVSGAPFGGGSACFLVAFEAVAESPGLGAGVDDVRAVGEAVDDGFRESGSGNTLVHSPNGRFVVTIRDARSLRSEMIWNRREPASPTIGR